MRQLVRGPLRNHRVAPPIVRSDTPIGSLSKRKGPVDNCM